MKRHIKFGKLCILFLSLLLGTGAYSQDTSSSDGLLVVARKAAFDKTDYPLAKIYLYRALKKSPDYADVKIFLGRIYTWTKNYDSARYFLNQVLTANPDYEDATVALVDLEFYDDHYEKALEICREGIKSHPGSEALLFREAKMLNALKRYEDADRVVQKLLLINEKNSEALLLAKTIQGNRNPQKIDSIIEVPTINNIKNKDSLSSEGLFMMARDAAFEEKNYELAKKRLYRALHLSPDYADIRIFLGRIHSWNKEYDSARYHFNKVLKKNPSYEAAAAALTDLEYWDDKYAQALTVVDTALVYHPQSLDLLIKKAKIENAMRRYTAAQLSVDKAFRINRNNSELRSLANRIKEYAAKNKIGVSYDYAKFDQQFADPWHLVSLDYTRVTGIGSVTGRLNYANKFKESGTQYEVEAYPRISNTFYTYVSLGYSDNVGIFPQWRGGFSLYANLPKSFETELGFRYLKFTGVPTYIYTAYLGKYIKSWLLSGRVYITPSDFTNTVSTSYAINAGYYYGSSDDLIRASFGYGISPDDRLNANQLDYSIRLLSYRAGLTYKKKIATFHVLTLDVFWANQEYLPGSKGNQFQIGAGWLYRF